MVQRPTRRGFLRGTLAAAAFPAVWTRGLHDPVRRRVGPNDRIGLGIIGVGDLARGFHVSRFKSLGDYEFVALADPDEQHLAEGKARTGGSPALYRDFRKLLEHPGIDAVLVATPDHWHAMPTIHACRAGKDVYCEKPLSLTIDEGRAMVEAVTRHGRVLQVGTQQRSDARFHRACQIVRDGHLGKILEVTCVLGQGPTRKAVPDEAPPKHLDWDLWLGPAPAVPYNPARCHYDFRWFYDTSGGKLTDWGAHHLDIALHGLGPRASGVIEVSGTATNPPDNFFETPVDFDIRFRFPETGVAIRAVAAGENGVTFRGTDASVFVSRGTIRVPEDLGDAGTEGSARFPLPRSSDHHENFTTCLRTRGTPVSDVLSGHRAATLAHLGNIAVRLGRQVVFDPATERFQDDPIADRFLSKPYRAPWSLR